MATYKTMLLLGLVLAGPAVAAGLDDKKPPFGTFDPRTQGKIDPGALNKVPQLPQDSPAVLSLEVQSLTTKVKALAEKVAALEKQATAQADQIAQLQQADKTAAADMANVKGDVKAAQNHYHALTFPNVTATCYEGNCNVVSTPPNGFTGPALKPK